MELYKSCCDVCRCVTEHSPVLTCDYHLSAALKKNGHDSEKVAETVKEGSFELSLCLFAAGCLLILLPCMMHHTFCGRKKKK